MQVLEQRLSVFQVSGNESSLRARSPRGLEEIAGAAIGDTSARWQVSPTGRRNDDWQMDFSPSSGCDGRVYPAAEAFLHEVDTLRREILSHREVRKASQPRSTNPPVRSLTSFHTDSRYGGDLHRADMAWASHAAAHGLLRNQIEHETLNGRDLSKKGPPLRRLAYVMRTASKAIALSK